MTGTQRKKQQRKDLLVLDISGTNTSIAHTFFDGKKITIKAIEKYKTHDIAHMTKQINTFCQQYKDTKKCKAAILAIAGPTETNTITLTNAPNTTINIKHMLRYTHLNEIHVMNDFQALGHATSYLPKSQFVIIQKGKTTTKQEFTSKLIIGAGTGLGKTVTQFSAHYQAQIPYPSEGGHTSVPAVTVEELEIFEQIKKLCGKKKSDYLTYEDILCGRGVQRLYAIFSKNKQNTKLQNKTQKTIITTANQEIEFDPLKDKSVAAKKTQAFFTKIMARCIRNSIIDMQTLAGVYIAGGISINNPQLYTQKIFKQELLQGRFAQHIKNVPIYVFKHYSASIYGAAFAGYTILTQK